ncbi:Spc97 [Tritrichomonas foetus]|uniref:Spc97 n=1 Tax=Tritrichomonas foetus TaxID=1144522 RepID=A0A1J4K0G1_9EUKA|nr:Spc97 [Tritrichomonas foetus]|eukprot:OHT03260.1 Spc97 [Tritrichomonas foetus]
MDENFIPDWLEDESIILIPDDFESNDTIDISALSKDYEEQLLVSDLIYCLVGASGTYFKPDKSGKLVLTTKLRNSLNRSFIDFILPLCNDVSFIKKFSETHFTLEYGRVLHALCASLKVILSDFTQFIAKIESFQQLTLPMLASNLEKHFDTMHAVSELLSQVRNKRGCKALSIIYNYMTYNCKTDSVRKIMYYVFQSSSEPLLAFIEKWIYNGVVDDPFEEFFIKVNEAIMPEDYMDEYQGRFWQLRFLIVEKQIPVFLQQTSILKILLAGKSKAVLNICGEKLDKSTGLSIQSLQRGIILDSVLYSASLQLMNVMRTKYNIVHYFKMFHSVYLCARGSWISLLFHNSKDSMKAAKQKIHLSSLDVSISMALPENMQDIFYSDMEDELLSEQVKETFIDLGNNNKNDRTTYPATSTNWDFFDVKSRIEWPLILFFPQTIQQKYQLLFRNILLWRRLEYKLNKLWHSSQGIKSIDNMRSVLSLFTRGYLDFISLYVINPQWSKLIDVANKVRNIEDLFKLHDDSISIAYKGMFLNDPRLFSLISCILFLGFQFHKEVKKWVNSTSNKVTEIKTKKQLIRPILKIFEAFQRKVLSLISKLNEIGKTDELYSDFLLWINANNCYK